jgi:hypothetical protein
MHLNLGQLHAIVHNIDRTWRSCRSYSGNKLRQAVLLHNHDVIWLLRDEFFQSIVHFRCFHIQAACLEP